MRSDVVCTVRRLLLPDKIKENAVKFSWTSGGVGGPKI